MDFVIHRISSFHSENFSTQRQIKEFQRKCPIGVEVSKNEDDVILGYSLSKAQFRTDLVLVFRSTQLERGHLN